MKFFKNKKKCLNCMFFSIRLTPPNSKEYIFSVSKIKRKQIEEKILFIEEDYTYYCYKKIWDCGLNPSINKNLLAIVNKKRNPRNCYFFKYDEKRDFKSTEESFQRNIEYKKQDRSIILSIIGLIITIIGIVVSYYK